MFRFLFSLVALGLCAGFVFLAAGAHTVTPAYGNGPGLALLMILQG